MDPKVTIGLPVYNGEAYLAEAIQSVLDQTFRDLDLVICDNGSTDATEQICRDFMARDDRVRVIHSPENRGASWSYNHSVEMARGKYFRWLAHDDKFDPQLVEKSVAILDENPEVVSCITWFMDIDHDGNPIEVKRSTVQFDAERPNKRFLSMSEFRPSYNCEEVFGLIRIDALRRTRLIEKYADSDRTLIAELGLHGPFHEIPEPLFLHRLHPKSSVEVYPSRQERTVWFDPSRKGKLVFPNWRQYFELLTIIAKSPISADEKLLCYRHMLHWTKRGRYRLIGDINWAIQHIARES